MSRYKRSKQLTVRTKFLVNHSERTYTAMAAMRKKYKKKRAIGWEDCQWMFRAPFHRWEGSKYLSKNGSNSWNLPVNAHSTSASMRNSTWFSISCRCGHLVWRSSCWSQHDRYSGSFGRCINISRWNHWRLICLNGIEKRLWYAHRCGITTEGAVPRLSEGAGKLSQTSYC